MPINSFEYVGAPYRVVFGRDTTQQLPSILQNSNVKAILILSTPEQISIAEEIRDILGDVAVAHFSKATMHTPVHITEEAVSVARGKDADCVVSIGGGSTIGLGKAICIRTGLKHICIPTTYAGSEMTPILGETEAGRKTTRRDPRILPDVVLYDVKLTKTLPARMSIFSGINAIAHAVEALYAENSNPVIELMACDGIKSLCEALPVLRTDMENDDARDKALYGAWLCGLCLGSVDMALHHKLCHTLGGTFNLPHSDTHVIVLPHAIAYNASAVPRAMERLANSLPDAEGDALKGLNLLYGRLGIDIGLKDIGMPKAGIDEATDIAVVNPYKNPRPLERAALRELIRRAWAGEPAKGDLSEWCTENESLNQRM